MHDSCDRDQCCIFLGGVAKEKKRNSNKTLGQNMAPMPASKLAYSLQGLEEVNLSTAPQRWSKERCRSCLAKVMSCLQVLLSHSFHNVCLPAFFALLFQCTAVSCPHVPCFPYIFWRQVTTPPPRSSLLLS